tara:strand:+ start:440 stop:925 length:486 start_codon:yes stop_codon:yes gene_type:complete
MNRTIAVLAVLALGLNSAMAQDVAPAAPAAAPAAPAATDIVVDPAAAIPTAPKQANLLTGFYATLAVIDICAIPVADDVKAGMAGDQKRLEASVGLDEASAAKAYAEVKTDVEKTTPDCAEGSADRASVDAVTGIYAAAAGGAPVATEAPLAAPVPATPTR